MKTSVRFLGMWLVLAVAAAGLAQTAGATARDSKLVTTINVIAGKPSTFAFKLSKSSASRGIVIFKISNQGILPHDFKVCSTPNGPSVNTCNGKSSKMISPGAGTTLTVTFLRKGNYEYLCTVPGHAAAGMKGILKIS